MSGVQRRTALFANYKDGIYDTGWRKCVTPVGSMVEPAPFSKHLKDATDDYDIEVSDMISHIDDLEWMEWGNNNTLCGTISGVRGSADGPVHGGLSTIVGVA